MVVRVLYCFLLLSLLSSCSEEYYFENTISFEKGSWHKTAEFGNTFVVEDTLSRYDLFLDITHDTDYAYQNVYLLVTTLFPNGKQTDQQLPVNFADNKGKWHGDCNGEMCDLRVVLSKSTKFKEAGTYTITFGQYSRMQELPSLHNLAFRISEVIED